MSCFSCSSDNNNNNNKNGNSVRCADLTSTSCCQPRCDFAFDQTLAAGGDIKSGCFPAVDAPSQLDSDFGIAMALSADGSVLAVAAPKYIVENIDQAGAVFVFERKVSFSACATFEDDGKFRLVQVLLSCSPTTGGAFGFSVAISGNGNRIAVGATNEDENVGKVYVFDRKSHAGTESKSCGPSLWRNVQTVVGQRREENSCKVVVDVTSFAFGSAIALSRNGNVLVVSSGSAEGGITPRVYFFEDCSPPFATLACGAVCKDAFSFVQRLTQEEVAEDANNDEISNIGDIGFAIALTKDGSTVVFSAPFANLPSTNFAGAVFVYRRKSVHAQKSSWKFSQTIFTTLPPRISGENFGYSLAITPCGKYLAVESFQGDGALSTGFATVYKESCKGGKSQYAQDGNYLSGTFAIDSNAANVSLVISDDGCVVAMGLEFSTVSDQSSGVVLIFDRKCEQSSDCSCSTVWVRRENTLFQQNPEGGAFFGSALVMDGAGFTLAAGAAGTNADLVSVFLSSFKPRHCRK